MWKSYLIIPKLLISVTHIFPILKLKAYMSANKI